MSEQSKVTTEPMTDSSKHGWYEFDVVIRGYGTNKEEAWENAIENMVMAGMKDWGPPPEEYRFEPNPEQ